VVSNTFKNKYVNVELRRVSDSEPPLISC